MGSDIMKPKRYCLTSQNFERLVFLKGNIGVLEHAATEEYYTSNILILY
jgi:hypothetical protein